MSPLRCRRLHVPLLAIALGTWAWSARADEATAKVVWYDGKNSSLLLECPDKGCPKIPNAKTGETYTFMVPESLRKQVAEIKEGEVVKVVYDDAKEKGYIIQAISR
jgi:hypothetical protein